MGHQLLKSILLKCSVSRTSGSTVADFQIQQELLFIDLNLHNVLPLSPHSYLLSMLSFICKPKPWSLSWISPSFPVSVSKPSSRPFNAQCKSKLVSPSTTAASDHHHLIDFQLWVGILILVLQFAIEDLFLKCSSEQIPESPSVPRIIAKLLNMAQKALSGPPLPPSLILVLIISLLRLFFSHSTPHPQPPQSLLC